MEKKWLVYISWEIIFIVKPRNMSINVIVEYVVVVEFEMKILFWKTNIKEWAVLIEGLMLLSDLVISDYIKKIKEYTGYK